MKIKLQSSETGPLLDAVMKLCQLPPKEASNFIREHVVHKSTRMWILVDVDMPRERIETIISYIPGIEVQFLDEEQIDDNDIDTTAQESANEQGGSTVQEAPIEITDDDLGISIRSVDEQTIEWHNNSLFAEEQPPIVIAGLKSAGFSNVKGDKVLHNGEKAIMVTFSRNFSSGTTMKKLEDFSEKIHKFLMALCMTVNLEEELRCAKETVTTTLDDIYEYE